MKDTCQIGDNSEAHVLAKFVAKGWTVLIPWGQKRFDFVIDRGKGFERVQVKTGRLVAGAVVAKLYSSNPYGDKKSTRTYTKKEIDLFAIYCPQTNEVYLMNVGIKNCNLRVEMPKNNQRDRVKFAKDFRI